MHASFSFLVSVRAREPQKRAREVNCQSESRAGSLNKPCDKFVLDVHLYSMPSFTAQNLAQAAIH